jgi:hypothetical protein
VLRYALERRDSVVSLMPDSERQLQLRGRTAFVTVTWVATDTVTRFSAAIDSLVGDPDLEALPAQLDSARSTRWTADRRPGGGLTNFAATRHSLVADQVRDELALLFPPLPPGGVRPGDIWQDSTGGQVRLSAFETTEHARASLRASPSTSSGEASALNVISIRSRSAESKAGQFNQPFDLTAVGADSLSYRLGTGGRVSGASGIRRSDLALQFPAIGQRITLQELSVFHMELLSPQH